MLAYCAGTAWPSLRHHLNCHLNLRCASHCSLGGGIDLLLAPRCLASLAARKLSARVKGSAALGKPAH